MPKALRARRVNIGAVVAGTPRGGRPAVGETAEVGWRLESSADHVVITDPALLRQLRQVVGSAALEMSAATQPTMTTPVAAAAVTTVTTVATPHDDGDGDDAAPAAGPTPLNGQQNGVGRGVLSVAVPLEVIGAKAGELRELATRCPEGGVAGQLGALLAALARRSRLRAQVAPWIEKLRAAAARVTSQACPPPDGAAAVASFLAGVLTEIYLCNVCSCQTEVVRRNGRGQAAAGCGCSGSWPCWRDPRPRSGGLRTAWPCRSCRLRWRPGLRSSRTAWTS